jgi:hypothetical protein
MSASFGTFLVGIIYLAVLFVLVRPGSQGPTLITNVADGLSNLVNAGTGGGGWNAGAAKLKAWGWAGVIAFRPSIPTY